MADSIDRLVLELAFEAIQKEARLLEQCIKEAIANYKASYSPIRYDRTGAWEGSVFVGKPRLEKDLIIIDIGFNDSVMHPSKMGQEQGDVSWLMHDGVRWGRAKGIKPNKFSNWEGTDYLKKALAKFNSQNQSGLKVEVYRGGFKISLG